MKTLILILFTAAYLCPAISFGQETVVIVNAANPATSLSASQIKLIYLRKINKRWKEINKNIVPVDRKGEADSRKKFLQDILQMTSDEVTRYFTEREYQNAEAPPVKFGSDNEILDFVQANPGAIGFVPKSAVKSDNKVKILLSF
jgi:ABC-type phosphate transport system substrate-binding protein